MTTKTKRDTRENETMKSAFQFIILAVFSLTTTAATLCGLAVLLPDPLQFFLVFLAPVLFGGLVICAGSVIID